MCDGDVDCEDGSDEGETCELITCELTNKWTCPDGKCILTSYVCDGSNDCSDGADEFNCSSDHKHFVLIHYRPGVDMRRR